MLRCKQAIFTCICDAISFININGQKKKPLIVAYFVCLSTAFVQYISSWDMGYWMQARKKAIYFKINRSSVYRFDVSQKLQWWRWCRSFIKKIICYASQRFFPLFFFSWYLSNETAKQIVFTDENVKSYFCGLSQSEAKR